MNARPQNHLTPIHLPAANGHLGIVKLLLEYGAEVHALNSDGQTPYETSLVFGYREMADLLCSMARTKQGYIPLSWSQLLYPTGASILALNNNTTWKEVSCS